MTINTPYFFSYSVCEYERLGLILNVCVKGFIQGHVPLYKIKKGKQNDLCQMHILLVFQFFKDELFEREKKQEGNRCFKGEIIVTPKFPH